MNKNNYRNGVLALLFMLIALPAAMMAQTNTERYMVVTENDGTVTVFDFDEVESVTWDVPVPEPEPLPGSFGTGKANIGGHKVDVEWIQLWADGPRFAKYNVGVTDGKPESFGGYYCWGSIIDQDQNRAYNTSNVSLTGTDDTATHLWGYNWRMPTQTEFDALLANCDAAWTDNYKNSGVKGVIFTGKDEYNGNCVFLPTTGYFFSLGIQPPTVKAQGSIGYYWSSTTINNRTDTAFELMLNPDNPKINNGISRTWGGSVRAIYDPTKNTAKATIDGEEVDVPWVQLWEDGPKFAEYNVGVTDDRAESYGGLYCWGSSIDRDRNYVYKSGTDVLTGTDDTATNLWGSNWRMPTKAEFDELLANCDVVWTDNYKFSGIKGRIFTGKGDFKGSSVFFPAASFCRNGKFNGISNGCYWSSTPDDISGYYLTISSNVQNVNTSSRSYGYSVRAVLAE